MGDDSKILNMPLKDVCTFFEKFWSWRLQNSPEFATLSSFHEYDDEMEVYTFDAIKNREVASKKFLEEAKELLQSPDLDMKARESLELLISELTVFIKGHGVKGYYFPISYFEGPHLEFGRLIQSMKFESVEDYQKLFSRFKALSVQINQMIEMMREGIKEKLTFHALSVNTVSQQLEQIFKTSNLDLNPDECVFYKPFLSFPDSILQEQKESFKKEAIALISSQVIPAFKILDEFIQKEYMNHVRPNPGITTVPRGSEFYQLCLDFHLGFHLTPKEVHERGLAEVTRISKEIEKVIKSLGYEKMSIKDFAEHLRNDEQFYYKNPEDLLQGYRNLVYKIITPKLETLFKDIPQAEVVIEPLPPASSNGPAAYYLAGSPDGRRPGVFYVNASDVKSAPKYQMKALALHEALPGHHLQQSYLYTNEDLPNFRKYMEDRKYSEVPSRFPLHSAYVEGWGLYSEYLGIELGVYEDKYDYFAYLSQEIFRAARLVVDTGLHAFSWTPEQAVTYMIENTASSKRDIENEVTRYITLPGQACAYKIGEMKIKSLRKIAENDLGSKFNIKDFHEVVLNYCGPLDILEQKVMEFIKRQKELQ